MSAFDDTMKAIETGIGLAGGVAAVSGAGAVVGLALGIVASVLKGFQQLVDWADAANGPCGGDAITGQVDHPNCNAYLLLTEIQYWRPKVINDLSVAVENLQLLEQYPARDPNLITGSEHIPGTLRYTVADLRADMAKLSTEWPARITAALADPGVTQYRGALEQAGNDLADVVAQIEGEAAAALAAANIAPAPPPSLTLRTHQLVGNSLSATTPRLTLGLSVAGGVAAPPPPPPEAAPTAVPTHDTGTSTSSTWSPLLMAAAGVVLALILSERS